ncbi:RNA pseudouridine synthase [Helicobacter sp. MIT 14-3879]|uniref:pseudouridine synthase family protein n=1 Tax=Helicobacter sp. MIT 14-3879 TaxID=2040649 RepID=UPI000E1EC07B|nr:RluA family pseudouridine synthase [Helicobacter sp. MIT 14-3879]RDU65181.1 RNA pseudouridine synthase [Helicobacter sp. MIT 14-3879]
MNDKAYKILSIKSNISNREAKNLLDAGLVYSNGKKIRASDIISNKIPLKILEIEDIEVLFKDSNILALNKPNIVDSSILEQKFSDYSLLHRLDKPTSGVILLAKKNSNFYNKAVDEFKNKAVYKEYLALVSGIVAEEITIDKPISTFKNHYAKSKIDFKNGKSAITKITPLKLYGKKTLLKVVITTGRTHQIRIHLSSINHPILGDSVYGGISYKRLMLHSYKINIFNYKFCASRGNFWKYLLD